MFLKLNGANLRICKMIPYLLHFLVLFICESSGQGFCPKNKPVVKFCTINGLTNLTDVYIDTISVPLHQESLCECVIFRSNSVQFSFLFYEEPLLENMVFKINVYVLNSKDNKFAWSGDTAKLSLLTTKDYTNEGACLIVLPDDNSSFNITCAKPTTARTDTSTSFSSIGSSSSTGQQVPDTTPHIEDDKDSGGSEIMIIVIPTVIGASLIVAAVVILLIYVKRRGLAKETKLQGNEHHQSVPTQSQSQQNHASTEESGHSISVNQYEKLNMYVNDNLTREMYQQLEADKNEEYQEMHDVENTSRNQDRDQTQSITGHVGGQGNVSRGNERKPETTPNAYERLNMYVNDKLTGEMYQQLNADQPSFSPGKNGFGKTDKSNKPTTAVYANEIPRDDAYDDLA